MTNIPCWEYEAEAIYIFEILVHPTFGLLNCANRVAGGRTTDSSPIFCTRIYKKQ